MKKSFIARHWKGELSLATSFWINLFLLNIVITVIYITIETLFEKNQFDPRLSFLLFFIMNIALIIIYPWQLVGTWRAANNHVQQTQRSFWAGWAKVLLVIGLLGTIARAPDIYSQTKEFWNIAFNVGEHSKRELALLQNGRELRISGGISFGLTKEVREFFSRNPNIEIIRLDSFGGRVKEARLLRDFIEENGLMTYSANGCLSACTIPFLSGSERVLNKRAKLGFHKYKFPGVAEEEFREEHDRDKKYLVSVGVDNSFANKAYSTSPEDMWYPTHQELLAANVITRLTNGKEFGIVYSTKSENSSEIENLFLKIPIYQHIRDYDPETFQALILEAKLRFSQGASTLDIIHLIRSRISKSLIKTLPIAPNNDVVSYTRVMVSEIRQLTAADPELCFKFLFPEKYGSIDIQDYISEEVQKSDLDALSAIYIGSVRSPQEIPKETEVIDHLDRAYSAISKKYGEAAFSFFENPDIEPSSKNDICNMIADLYENILEMPIEQSGPTLRFMFAP
tara:strand:- start:830 stop:2362 length:1533 start_codon:yes stop_codon:yes gene_type:complete